MANADFSQNSNQTPGGFDAGSYREAADSLLKRMEPGDALLVKASHGMALEKVLEIFYAEQKDVEA